MNGPARCMLNSPQRIRSFTHLCKYRRAHHEVGLFKRNNTYKSYCLHGAYIFIVMGEKDNKQINKIKDLSC